MPGTRRDFAVLDATAQADLVRSGEVTPIELVDAAIERIERINPDLNAVILPSFDRAREQARGVLPDGPFRGVPILMKDLGGNTAGEPLYAGMRLLREVGWREERDSHFTAKLRAAGFVILGRTNTPELGLVPTTEPESFGPTRNPWNAQHSPGGSSGGSAAAVATGMVAVAHASDGGGSIRIPASSCGLVGLKPTRGRCSFGPEIGERWSGFSCEHVLTRTVRDTAALLDVVAGPMPGDPYFAPPPRAPFASALAPGPRLRVGLMTNAPRQTPVHADCVTAVEAAAHALADLGHEITPSYPSALDDNVAIQNFVATIATSTAAALESWGRKVGRVVTEQDVEPLTWAVAETARKRTAIEHLATLDSITAISRRIAAWWADGFDLLLTPTVADPPPPIGHLLSTRDDPFRGFLRAAPFGAYTSLFNLTGQPGISVPMHWSNDGLPIGAHLVAPYGREDILLSVAAELESARPWSDRHPPSW